MLWCFSDQWLPFSLAGWGWPCSLQQWCCFWTGASYSDGSVVWGQAGSHLLIDASYLGLTMTGVFYCETIRPTSVADARLLGSLQREKLVFCFCYLYHLLWTCCRCPQWLRLLRVWHKSRCPLTNRSNNSCFISLWTGQTKCVFYSTQLSKKTMKEKLIVVVKGFPHSTTEL